ncbi:Uncharacterized conserved protein, DUF427 family [Flavobacterium segetis]|uniref:Uncharacterized conserved protein, DUF427 family n=1 Tax=Flavobacterium segetis TaxID=271157 RepID=A0A1M5IWF4_9FLAO|nr:DUF427 domain-containing protein [Flavobacterium segetis]SHG32652.1 Uncharacterized conserved protein, DUF427 family [Flavobacterium segetis]
MKAIFNKVVIAESQNTVVVEGNHYFPFANINWDYFTETSYHTTCPWKGKASYYTVKVNDEVGENAAWFYKEPKDAATKIKDHVAFWKKVTIEE